MLARLPGSSSTAQEGYGETSTTDPIPGGHARAFTARDRHCSGGPPSALTPMATLTLQTRRTSPLAQFRSVTSKGFLGSHVVQIFQFLDTHGFFMLNHTPAAKGLGRKRWCISPPLGKVGPMPGAGFLFPTPFHSCESVLVLLSYVICFPLDLLLPSTLSSPTSIRHNARVYAFTVDKGCH